MRRATRHDLRAAAAPRSWHLCRAMRCSRPVCAARRRGRGTYAARCAANLPRPRLRGAGGAVVAPMPRDALQTCHDPGCAAPAARSWHLCRAMRCKPATTPCARRRRAVVAPMPRPISRRTPPVAWRPQRRRATAVRVRFVDAVELTGRGLSASDVVAVARDGAAVRLAPIAVDLMTVGADAVQLALHAPEPAYGVSHGVRVARERRDPGRSPRRAAARARALACRGHGATGRARGAWAR